MPGVFNGDALVQELFNAEQEMEQFRTQYAVKQLGSERQMRERWVSNNVATSLLALKTWTKALEHAVDAVIRQIRQRLCVQRLGLVASPRQQVAPPWEEELLHNELEPRRKRRWIQLGHESLQLFWRDPFCIADLIEVGLEGDFGSDEKDVVDLVLAPDVFGVAIGCEIVDTGEVLKLV